MEDVYTYIAELLTASEADAAFAALRGDLDWVRHDGVPRAEYYSNDTDAAYTYGVAAYARTYLPQPWHPWMLEIRSRLRGRLGYDLDVCFNNLYLNQRDHLGWHADDSPEMDDQRGIVSVSLGVERDIQIRSNETGEVATVRLGHGSAFVMHPGVQDTHRHRIPKSGFVIGERISLTYRGYVPA